MIRRNSPRRNLASSVTYVTALTSTTRRTAPPRRRRQRTPPTPHTTAVGARSAHTVKSVRCLGTGPPTAMTTRRSDGTPSHAPGSSDTLVCRRWNTSILCADFWRTHVIFDPIHKSKKIFWASVNHPFSLPLEFKIINIWWVFTSNFVFLIFKSSNMTLHQTPLHLLSWGNPPRTIPTLTIPYLSNFKLCCYFSYLH